MSFGRKWRVATMVIIVLLAAGILIFSDGDEPQNVEGAAGSGQTLAMKALGELAVKQ